jgi:hypothetical protein
MGAAERPAEEAAVGPVARDHDGVAAEGIECAHDYNAVPLPDRTRGFQFRVECPEASANRSKGAQGPLEWLPPNVDYRCEYVTRFHRIVLTYRLEYQPGEAAAMDRLRAELCG